MSLHPRHRFILHILQQTFKPLSSLSSKTRSSAQKEQNRIDQNDHFCSYKKSIEKLLLSKSILDMINYFFSAQCSYSQIFLTYIPPDDKLFLQSTSYKMDVSEFIYDKLSSQTSQSNIKSSTDQYKIANQMTMMEGCKENGYLLVTDQHDLLWSTHTRVFFRKKKNTEINTMVSLDSSLIYGTFNLGVNSIFMTMKNVFLPVLFHKLRNSGNTTFEDTNDSRMFQPGNNNLELLNKNLLINNFIQKALLHIEQMDRSMKSFLIHPKCYGLEFSASNNLKFNQIVITVSEALLLTNIYRLQSTLGLIETYGKRQIPFTNKNDYFLPSDTNHYDHHDLPQSEINFWKNYLCNLQQIRYQIDKGSTKDMIQMLEQMSNAPSPNRFSVSMPSVLKEWANKVKRLDYVLSEVRQQTTHITTIEPYIKDIALDSEFDTLKKEGIPRLMMALKVRL